MAWNDAGTAGPLLAIYHLERCLSKAHDVAGDEFTIANLACFHWLQTWKAQEFPFAEFRNVKFLE
jgi:glutathione S-transferase